MSEFAVEKAPLEEFDSTPVVFENQEIKVGFFCVPIH